MEPSNLYDDQQQSVNSESPLAPSGERPAGIDSPPSSSASSQSLYDQPSSYPPGQVGQPSPYSQPLQEPAPPAATAPKRSLRWVWIALSVVVILGLLLGGGLFAFANYTAPAAAAGAYCNYLKAQNYDSAYDMLSLQLHSHYSAEQFRQASIALDSAEGKVAACGVGSGSNAYKYMLFGNTATVLATTTREKQGLLQGEVRLVNDHGWKVDSIGVSLLGISFAALDTFDAFCAALEEQDYTAAYTKLTPGRQFGASADEFVTEMKVRDIIDGPTHACAIEQITDASETSATVRAGFTRNTLGQRVAAISLIALGDSWAVDQVADALLGTDVVPLVYSTAFCLYGWRGQYEDAFTFLSGSAKTRIKTPAGLAPSFTLSNGAKVTLCVPNVSAYAVTGESTSIQFTLNAALPNGQPAPRTFEVSMSEDAVNHWWVEDWKLV